MLARRVRLYKDPFTVVGVAPAQFHGTEKFVWPDYWIPIVNWGDLHTRSSPSVTVLGRLKPGVTPQQATDNLNAIAAQMAKEYQRRTADCRCGWSVPDSLQTTVTSFADSSIA